MQEVAVGHYRAFITAAEAVQSIRKEISAVDQHLEKLVTSIDCLLHIYAVDAGLALDARAHETTVCHSKWLRPRS